MAVASVTLSLSLHLLPIPKPKNTFTISSHRPLLPFPSPNLSATHYFRSSPISAVKLSSGLGNYLISEAPSPPETSQEILATSSPGVSNIIQSLLFVAFIGLSILTVGVIYIAVTDFLTKRERDKFEKEETAKKKRSGKKGNVRAKPGGPRGFGQKVQIDDDFDY